MPKHNLRIARNAVLAGSLMLIHGACDEKMPEPKPPAPDMTALVHAYSEPSLELNQDNVARVMSTQALLALTMEQAIAVFPQFNEAFARRSSSDAGSDQANPLENVSGEGFLRVTRICPGPTTTPSPDPTNGFVQLIVGFTDRGVDPVVWGGFSQCKMNLKGVFALVDGQVSMHLGENLQFSQVGSSALTVQVALKLTTGDSTVSIDVDFRYTPEGALEYRVIDSDSFIIYWESGLERGVRAKNGTWSCNLSKRTCSSNGSSLSF